VIPSLALTEAASSPACFLRFPILIVLALLLACVSPACAQTTSTPPATTSSGANVPVVGSATPAAAAATPANIYAAGISYNNGAQPAVAGTALYARLVSDGSGTYAFTAADALPNSVKPFTVTTDISAGIAQKVFSLGSVPIFVPTSAGVSFNGTNTGWAWSTGALAAIHLKGNWRIFPMVRIARSNVSNGSGVQPIVGILIGWGQ
jgi:hypothetical protein